MEFAGLEVFMSKYRRLPCVTQYHNRMADNIRLKYPYGTSRVIIVRTSDCCEDQYFVHDWGIRISIHDSLEINMDV